MYIHKLHCHLVFLKNSNNLFFQASYEVLCGDLLQHSHSQSAAQPPQAVTSSSATSERGVPQLFTTDIMQAVIKAQDKTSFVIH
jgi:hypothetical protein